MATVRTLIGYVKGPKGDTGATGATGPQGPAGQDGAPGVSDYATTEAAGLVRVGDDFSINPSNGILSIKNVWTKASTLAEMVSGEAFSTTLGKIAKALDAVVTIAGDYLKSTDIVDSLTSALTNKALSANKGKELKDALDSLNDSLNYHVIQGSSCLIRNTDRVFILSVQGASIADINALLSQAGISSTAGYAVGSNRTMMMKHGAASADRHPVVVEILSSGSLQVIEPSTWSFITDTSTVLHGQLIFIKAN